MTTGEKLAMLRRQKNLTQEQLAELLNVSRQSVSRWEMNQAFPETEKLILLSRIFSCSVDFLLNTSPEKEKNSSDITAEGCASFMRECGYFFLATSVEDSPNLRPFGMICAGENCLFFVTDKRKSVCMELEKNAKVSLSGYQPDTGKWLRISGTAIEDTTQKSREMVLSEYPVLYQKFPKGQEIFMTVYRICLDNANIHLR